MATPRSQQNDATPPRPSRHRNRSSSSSSSSSSSNSPPPPQYKQELLYNPTQPHPLLNFQNYNNRPNILSPRRSGRLLKKVGQEVGWRNCGGDGLGAESGWKNEASSDYGTLSNTTAHPPTLSTSLLLSDEVSLLSIEDLQPSQPPPPPPTVTHITQTTEKNEKIHLLLPQLSSYSLRKSFAVKIQPLTDTSVLDKLQIFTQVTLISVESDNYDFNLKPLICVPYIIPPYKMSQLLIYSLKNSDVSLLTTNPATPTHTSFYPPHPGHYLILPRPRPESIREQLDPDKELLLTSNSYPRISIKFPPHSTPYSLITTLEIHPDNLITTDFGLDNSTPAAHVFSLGPSSVSFLLPVEISVEVVDYKEITALFPTAKLEVYQCRENNIQKLNYTIETTSNTTTIHFTTTSFSYFRTIWTTLTSTLTSAQLGVCRLFGLSSSTQTLVKCLATMNEYNHERFGLEVCVYQGERPEGRAYDHVVGKTQSKFVRHGQITVSLKSSLFEANEEAGEEVGLHKEEEFGGKDFSVQFSLRFKGPIERGPFGKVRLKQRTTTIFEFNIQKAGNEGETTVQEEDTPSRWSTMALTELATNLFVTDGKNWKVLARVLKFTKHEIKTKFKTQPEPFLAILDFYKARGGSPEEFIKSLYEVNRELKFQSGSSSPVDSVSSRKSNRSNKSSGLGSSMAFDKKESSSSSSDTDKEMDADSGGSSLQTRESSPIKPRKRPAKSKLKSRKSKKRRKQSEEQETSGSSSDDVTSRKTKNSKNSKNSQYLKTSTTLISTSSIWAFTSHLTNSNFKALGRTLEIQESNLIAIEQSNKGNNRECYYQVLLAWQENFPKKCTFGNLYLALKKEGMVSVAKKMVEFFDAQ